MTNKVQVDQECVEMYVNSTHNLKKKTEQLCQIITNLPHVSQELQWLLISLSIKVVL